MIQKTSEPEGVRGGQNEEFSRDFIRLLVALTGATLVLVFLYEHQIFKTSQQLWPRMYLYPWVVAGGQTIANGLAEFSGRAPELVGLSDRLAGLLGLLFGMVIGPTLFFFGWYYRRKDRASNAATPTLKGASVIYVIGGILTFSVAIPAIPIAYVQRSVSSDLRAAQAIQSNKDAMINEVNAIAFNAYQYRILPQKLGGGNGSYIGYTVPPELSHTAMGTYTTTQTEDEVVIKGTAAQYPDASVSARIDNQGSFEGGSWNYTGVFL